MPRDVAEFKGNNLIVGGGWCAEHAIFKPSLRKPEHFYTLDIDEKAEPDKVGDITNPSILNILNRKFDFIHFECLGFNSHTLIQTFKIAYELLNENGVFLYRGGSRELLEPVTDLLTKAGFPWSTKKELHPNNPKAKYDKGSTTLASKKTMHNIMDAGHLDEAAQSYIRTYNFFDATFYRKAFNPFTFLIFPDLGAIATPLRLAPGLSFFNEEKKSQKIEWEKIIPPHLTFQLISEGEQFILHVIETKPNMPNNNIAMCLASSEDLSRYKTLLNQDLREIWQDFEKGGITEKKIAELIASYLPASQSTMRIV